MSQSTRSNGSDAYVTGPLNTSRTAALARARKALSCPWSAPDLMASRIAGMRPLIERPLTMPRMNSVSSLPTLNTSCPGHLARSSSAAAAARVT